MRSRCWKQQNKQQKSQTGGRAARCACCNFFIPKGTRTYALSHCPARGLTVRTVGAGVYISLRVLDIPDLTTEGSFGFGSALAAVLAAGGHTYLSLPIAFLGGMAAGLITGLLQTKLQVHPVLAGIITMSGLYSVNLIVRGGPNLSIGAANLFKQFYKALHLTGDQRKVAGALLALAICLVVTLLLIVFFKTHVGLCIRATGDNQDMVRASSINVDATLILGLCISNGLIGLAGALVTHYVGYSDTSTSNGTLIYGLAAVIIGEALFGKRGVTVGLISAVCGSVIYKLIVTFVVDIELFGTNSANLMKLMCAVIVAATFIIPAAKRAARNRKVKKEARRNA